MSMRFSPQRRIRSLVAPKSRLISCEPLEDRFVLTTGTVSAAEVLGMTDALLSADLFAEYRTIDGTGNNLSNPDWGSTGIQLIRISDAEYADGVSEPAGEDRVSAREISNAVASQETSIVNDRYLTDFIWQWGQFIDHDIDLTGGGELEEEFNIDVPAGDFFFDPTGTGEQVIELTRSIFDTSTGTDSSNPREQINEITALIDGSMVYGSDEETAAALRSFEGGKLRVTESENGDLLPIGESGSFEAGDVRANEQIALTSMHTLFVREHNWWADQLAAEHPEWTDEELYQQARSIVVAEIQSITYNEFLPALLGYDAIDDYEGYDPSVDPSIANEFSTAAYRIGHTMLSPELQRLNNDGTEAEEGSIALQNAFFTPSEVIDNGIDSLLLGLASQQAQEIDNQVIDDVRNFLFGPPGAGGFDLASLNIQRGRDHGLADYNQMREDYGLERVTSFADISSDPNVQANLASVYDSVDDIDAWVGMLAEDHLPGSSMGELASTVISDQFERIRDGDRFYYENVFSGEALAEIESTKLSDIIKRNTSITNIQDNVFYDSSVLYYKADGNTSAEMTVVIDETEVRIIDQRTGQVLESRAIEDVSQVHLVGTDLEQNRFTIDTSQAEMTLPGGIVIAGTEGERDVVTVRGSRDVDEVVIDSGVLTINGEVVQMSDVDVLRLGVQNQDNVEIVDADGVEVVTINQRRPGGGRDDGRDGGRDRDGRDGRGGGGPGGPGAQVADNNDGGGRRDRNGGGGQQDPRAVDMFFEGMMG
ncbi:peroxidase [Planctomycetes bacterium Pan216]|uniref:Peroxidase n=1 Tax=Kolteria novifilia TaxID=2527975 RepID=A0A518B2Y0_9BACT|nr:peroxidase [Planctomycetes bacterium Pan216]